MSKEDDDTLVWGIDLGTFSNAPVWIRFDDLWLWVSTRTHRIYRVWKLTEAVSPIWVASVESNGIVKEFLRGVCDRRMWESKLAAQAFCEIDDKYQEGKR